MSQVAALVGGLVILEAGGWSASDVDALPLTALALLQIPLWAGLVGVPLWATNRKGNGPVADLGLAASVRDAPVGLVAGAITQVVAVPLLYVPIFWLIGDRDVSEAARDITERADGGGGVFLLVVVTVVGAPVAEEIFFRGFVLRSLERRMSQRLALWTSALVFAVLHFQVLQLPALVLFGLVAGHLAQRYRRLGPPIFAHSAFNAVTVTVLLT